MSDRFHARAICRRARRASLLGAAVLGAASSRTFAVPVTWTDGNNNAQWQQTGNWNPNQIPSITDAAQFPAATGVASSSSRTFPMGASGGTFAPDTSTVFTLNAAIAANANSLTLAGPGHLSVAAASSRTGATSITGGTMTVNNSTALGSGA